MASLAYRPVIVVAGTSKSGVMRHGLTFTKVWALVRELAHPLRKRELASDNFDG